MIKILRMKYAVFLLFLLNIWLCTSQTVYIVNSTGDSGDIDLADLHCADENGNCSLRAAIENANKSPVKDRVHFNITCEKGPLEILLHKNLPAITEPLELDATTQPGYSTNNPKIILNGENIPLLTIRFEESISPIGFHLTGNSGGSLIKGFIIGGFGFTNDTAPPGKDMIYYPGTGIFIGTEKNIVQSNFVGLPANGSSSFSNIVGVLIAGSNNLIGGDKPEHKNVISNNWRSGILCHSNNHIKGNLIGTDARGNKALGNPVGIALVTHSKNNILEDNLISGNTVGISITGDKNIILNNKIGTNFGGTKMLPNEIGIKLITARENIIKGNLISGNNNGMWLDQRPYETPQNNKIWKNLIGTDIKGKEAVPNSTGIYINGGISNVIGGANPEHRNIISGNLGAGIKLSEAKENSVTGNFIGIDLSGKEALPNNIGIEFSGEPEKDFNEDNIINNNLISGNDRDGIQLNFAKGNSLFCNLIGTAKDGITPLPNAGNGIKLSRAVINNCIGSSIPGNSNLIAYNRENGIFITAAPGVEKESPKIQLFTNNIFSNNNFKILFKEKEQQKGTKAIDP